MGPQVHWFIGELVASPHVGSCPHGMIVTTLFYTCAVHDPVDVYHHRGGILCLIDGVILVKIIVEHTQHNPQGYQHPWGLCCTHLYESLPHEMQPAHRGGCSQAKSHVGCG